MHTRPEFWVFTLYDKDETEDLTPKQREILKERVKGEPLGWACLTFAPKPVRGVRGISLSRIYGNQVPASP